MGKSIAVVVCCLSFAGSVVLGSSATAAAPAEGVITGNVMECGPGPVVQSPPAKRPSPKPASVILLHNKHVLARESIKFPKSPPWSGPFLFNVPVGRYEVVSTYFHRVRWVSVKAHGHVFVSFEGYACPL
ncbi:MAG TPA: hypothetical protein VNF05_09920 [Acidimicrobiales bacterium]|nr:hypothetical protein [Acidimicrobiales bacterium]